jgi:small subunit ribosomal protein S2
VYISNGGGAIFSNSETKNFKKLKLKVGDFSVVTIKALGTKNVGLAEISNGYTVIVPKAKLGETVKIQIEKISGKPKYATGKLIEVVKETTLTVPVKVDQVLEVNIEKKGPKNSGLYSLSNKFTIIVAADPKTGGFELGEKVKVQITRVKENYAFAQLVSVLEEQERSMKTKPLTSTTLSAELRLASNMLTSLREGSCFNIVLPTNSKSVGNYVVLKLKKSLVFVKLSLGVQLGETVRIKIVKTTPKYCLAKITKINPMSRASKETLVKTTLKKMVRSGMHYGEKTIRCHANMRKFLWIRKKGKNQNRPLVKKGRHILNVLKTRTCLNKSLQQLAKYAAKGKTFLFVGTKKPAASLIARTAMLTKTAYFVNTRWLGGMLTNWKTILKSISQIRPILKEKQKLIQKILEKRQKIKKRLLRKVNVLRKKTSNLLTKGKQLLALIKKDRNVLLNRSQKLFAKKAELVSKNRELLRKYAQLKKQRENLVIQTNLLQRKGNELIQQKAFLIEEMKKSKDLFEEFNQLNVIGQEILKLKQEMKQQGKTVWAVPFENMTNLENRNTQGLIPNPSSDLLNRMVQAMKLKYEKNNLVMDGLNNGLSQSVAREASAQNENRPKSSGENTVIMSQLLNKLTDYLPFIQAYMKTLALRIQTLQNLCKEVHEKIQNISEKLALVNSAELKAKIETSLTLIEQKLQKEYENFKQLTKKFKQLAAEQKLLKFLPKLRYLPTSKKKMVDTVEFLMKKFVDPKMSYSMDQVYNQKLKFTSKKLAAVRKQKWQRLEKYFGGITKMAKMKKKQITNNVVILIGQQEEMNAVQECRKLGMKMFTVVDTNCNPRLSDYIIPANDDSRNSIKYILGEMLTHIRLGQKLRKKLLAKRLA